MSVNKKISFLLDIDLNHKTGLFNAVHQRMKCFSENNTIESRAHIINVYDGFFIRLIKILTKKKLLSKKVSSSYEGVDYNIINIKHTLFLIFLRYFDFGLYAKVMAFKIKDRFVGTHTIVCHWGGASGIIGSYIGECLKVNTYIVFHGSDIHTLPYKNKKMRRSLITQMSKVKGNVFVSQELLNQSLDLGHEGGNNHVIYNGIDVKSIMRDVESDFLCKELDNKILIGFVGNLLPVKNAEILPDIFLEINRLQPGCCFLIIGDGYLKEDIYNNCKKLDLPVIFKGKVEPKEAINYINILDLLVIPSKNEALSLVALEARCLNTPVISSRVGGLPEAIGLSNTVELDEYFISNFSKLAVDKLNNPIVDKLDEHFKKEFTHKKEIELYTDEIN